MCSTDENNTSIESLLFSLVWIINKNTNSANNFAKRTQWLSSIGPEKVPIEIIATHKKRRAGS
jgi:hypothetical protein